MQCRLFFRNDEERQATIAAGIDVDAALTIDDLVTGDDVFFAATGITDGELLKGVRYRTSGASTDSIVMRSKTRTVRYIRTEHHSMKVAKFADE
jgi:fructose-1,6-bisphosphatase II